MFFVVFSGYVDISIVKK